jgi:hypothetical protein
LNKNKIVVFIFSFILVGLAGLYFYAQSVIEPEEIKKTITHKLEKALPGASVSLGELKVSYGPSILLSIEGMDILLKKQVMKKRDLLQIKKAYIRLPLVSILTGGGNLEVNLEEPELFLHRKKNEKGNWKEAFNKDFEDKKAISKNKPLSNSQNIILPAFLINSTIAFRLRDLKVYYDIDDKVGVWRASKFLIKNLGLNSNAAFEVQSNFKRVAEEKEKFSFDLTLIGSLEFSKYLKTGELNVNSNIRIKELSLDEGKRKLPLVRGDAFLSLAKDGSLKGNLKTFFKESSLSSSFEVTDTKQDLRIESAIIRSNDISDFGTNASWGPLSLINSSVELKGRIDLSAGQVVPYLTFKVDNLQLTKEGIKLGLSGIGKFEGDKITADLTSSSLGGNLEVNTEVNFKLNSSESFERRLTFYRVNGVAKEITINNEILSYLRKEEQKIAPGQVVEKTPNFLMPKGIVTITLEEANLGKLKVSGGGTLKTVEDQIEVKNGALLLGDGKLAFDGSARVYKDSLKWTIHSKLKNWPMKGMTQFFEGGNPLIDGAFSGDLTMDGLNRPLNIETVRVSLTSPKGELLRVTPAIFTKALEESLKRSPYFDVKKGKDIQKASSYSDLSLKGSFSKTKHIYDNLTFTTKDDQQFIIKGEVDPSAIERKRIKVWIKGDPNFQKAIAKKARLKTFPLGFWAKGYDLQEDPLYSLSILAKKMRFKKDREKVEDKIKEVKANIKKDKNEKS